MKKKLLTTLLGISALLFTFTITSVEAQEKFRLENKESSLTIKGTSSMHDWEMQAEKFTGSANSEFQSTTIENFKNAVITLDVESIESGKRIMNNKTYDALKSEKHPSITYKLSSIKDLYAAGNKFSGKAVGTLTVAGKSRNISIPFSGKVNNNGTELTVSGDYELQMTDYDIDPPTAMLGSLKTGDKVTIEYNFTFTQAK